MPPLTEKFITQLKVEEDANRTHPCFVETGTCTGGTIFALEHMFEELHTIEIKPEFYENVKRSYNKRWRNRIKTIFRRPKKISFYLGDSSIVLNSVTSKLNRDTIFFLDGHWSSGDTGKGPKDCPVEEELTSIASSFRHRGIIIIDDFRLFGKGPTKGGCLENWEDINKPKLLDIMGERLEQEYHLPSKLDPSDRLVLHISPIV